MGEDLHRFGCCVQRFLEVSECALDMIFELVDLNIVSLRSYQDL